MKLMDYIELAFFLILLIGAGYLITTKYIYPTFFSPIRMGVYIRDYYDDDGTGGQDVRFSLYSDGKVIATSMSTKGNRSHTYGSVWVRKGVPTLNGPHIYKLDVNMHRLSGYKKNATITQADFEAIDSLARHVCMTKNIVESIPDDPSFGGEAGIPFVLTKDQPKALELYRAITALIEKYASDIHFTQM
jgi:hypothetical protein